MNPTPESLVETLSQRGIQVPEGRLRIVGFGDSEALSAELIALIREGTKRGTCSMLWSWEFEGEDIPAVGDIGIVLDYADRPVMIHRITRVEIVPFNEVSAEFAASEGEGDRSLAYWRKAHWDFFLRECAQIGRTIDETMPLVCETFEVVETWA
ncbi:MULTISPECIES: ASCH domain-containing protein [Paraburkholderia]|jgi:uncharacterized protein YhfF|uniref:Uncharacterized protein YhfF n=1 Tax=Paraburkholderia phenazinium TaxID=60549 RepID=A0A1N6FJU0_9BURK|nr:ASCH domain-containing protein [Paraburkholderia phenazinium]SIN95529.1 Uncharacterized protein YhfF [Paraburkholderia phenazinium]